MIGTNVSEIVEQLPRIVGGIIAKEQRLFDLQCEVTQEKWALQIAEDEALLTGMADGKNAEVRDAQLRQITAPHRARLLAAERALGYAKIELSGLQLQFKALRTLALLLGGNDDL